MHPDHVVGWNGTFEELADSIGNMRYEQVAIFLSKLGSNIMKQGNADNGRKRFKLRDKLYETANNLHASSDSMRDAWEICEPFMRETDV